MYACGECFPRHRVDALLQGKTQFTRSLVGSDILVEFADPKLEAKLDQATASCKICYDFYFTGTLKRSGFKGIYLVVDAAKWKLRSSSCCGDEKH